MRNPDLIADVVVIGGGPGGSTAATMLARKGAKVLLLEREHFPREHVGESLLPASVPVLEELGVLPAIQQQGFLLKWGATMVWGRESKPWSWYFRETSSSYPHSYQVWRPQFDQVLLQNSRDTGVDVREGHHVLDVILEDGVAVGVRYSSDGGSEQIVRSDFVVDASGQGGILARKLRLRRLDPFFQNLAIYGYFSGAQRLTQPDETNIFIESYPQGWLWNIPLHTGWASVGAVVDAKKGQEGVRDRGLQAFLTDQLAQAPYTRRMLRDATLVSGPSIARDWSYVSERLVGDGYILVGDAACFVDPLFSSGVHLALMSGVLAAAYVTSALKDVTMREPAGRVYQELYNKEYSHFRELAKLFYTSNRTVDSYFWEARRILEAGEDLSPRHSFIRAVAGQPPRGYERAVLEHGEMPAGFREDVQGVESGRAERRARLTAVRTGDNGNPWLNDAVPRLATGVKVQRKPVVGEGEFVWGHVLSTSSDPEGTPCSPFVAKVVSLIDGRTSVAGLAMKLGAENSDTRLDQVQRNVLTTVEILYVDGAIAELKVL